MMKTISEKGEDDGSSGGFPSPETNKPTGVTHSTVIMPEDECNSSSSSSIGADSDADREDAESRYRYDPQIDNGFDDAIQALEQALPIRRGISKFYNGKSKSYTCLGDEWPMTSSVQDIAKPENAYTRKRRILGAFKLSNINTKQMCKKPKTSKLNFTIGKDHDLRPQINRPLALRSFSMVNLH